MTAQDSLENINNQIQSALKKSNTTSQAEEAIHNLLLVLEQTGLLNEESKKVLVFQTSKF